MKLISAEFLLLATAAVFLFHAGRSGAWRRIVLLIAGCVFLLSQGVEDGSLFAGVGGIAALSPILLFTAIGYAAVRICRRFPGRVPLVAGAIVLSYCGVKYWLPAHFSCGTPLATVGLSYILFRILHLILDEGRGEELPELSLRRYLEYVLFFLTFLSGPIWRYQDFSTQMADVSSAMPTRTDVHAAFSRITNGLLKVLVMSEIFRFMHSALFEVFTILSSLNYPHLLDSFSVVKLGSGIYYSFCALLYLFHMYYDFSGYMDIVIGVGRLFGLKIPENFDAPFESRDVLDFWNRWHVTLSQWVQNYVFTPLIVHLTRRFPGKRMQPLTGAAGYMVAFLVIGLWHDPNRRFLLFGLGLGVAASATKAGGHYLRQGIGKARYGALQKHWLYRAQARGVGLFAVAAALSALWMTRDNAVGVLNLYSAFGAATVGAFFSALLGPLSNIPGKIGAFLTYSSNVHLRDMALPGVLRAALSEVWLAVRVLVVLGILLSSTDRVPDFIYQGF